MSCVFKWQVPNNPRAQSQRSEELIWTNLEEPEIDIDELVSIFAIPETRKRKKAADGKAKPARVVAPSSLTSERSRNLGVLKKNLEKNNLDNERLELAIYNGSLSNDFAENIKKHMVHFSFILEKNLKCIAIIICLPLITLFFVFGKFDFYSILKNNSNWL